jgi:subfamily B ATP-binding cassette protein MsbA
VPLAVSSVALSGLATLFEGAGIVLILPFLQKLIDGRALGVTLPLPRALPLEQWINGVPPGRQLVFIGGGICVSIVLRELLTYLAGLIKLCVSMKVSDVCRARLHGAFVVARFDVASRYQAGHFQNFLYTETSRLRGLSAQLMALAENLAIAATVLALMALISPALTAVVTALLVAIALPLTRFFAWIHRSGFGRVESRLEIANYLAELIPFLRTVHVLDAQARERERFAARYRTMSRLDLQLYKVGALVGPIYHSVGAISVLGLAVAVVLLAGPGASVGWVVPFILLFSRLLPILNGMNLAISTLGDGFASFRRVMGEIEFLDGHRMPEGTRAFPSDFRVLEVRGVSFEYEADAPVLRGLTLRIERGRHIAIVGPSGCGKSTLCALIARLYDPSKGEIMVDGVDLREFRLASLRRAVTVVDQTPVLLNDTIRANIAYAMPEATDDAIRRAAARANAEEFIAEMPEGDGTMVGNLGTAVSGGQRQRIAIARALIRRPQILILDEATSAVDSKSEALIKTAIDGLKGELTVVTIAHRLSTIKDADEIYVLSCGGIVASGTFASLMASHGEFRAYVQAQDLSN